MSEGILQRLTSKLGSWARTKFPSPILMNNFFSTAIERELSQNQKFEKSNGKQEECRVGLFSYTKVDMFGLLTRMYIRHDRAQTDQENSQENVQAP